MPDLRALAQKLRALDAAELHAVTLPDFYLDHFVPLPTWDAVVPAWQQVHARGGGNVRTTGQHFSPGGNATNTALALARLGVRTHLVARTSPFGRAYLQEAVGAHGVDLRHVRADGRLSVTTALEFSGARPSNVMLSDPGSVAEFGPESLDANDWTLLEAADLVLVTNWSQNRRGTALAETVARAARKAGTLAMLDTGDPSLRVREIPEVLERLLPLDELDVYAMNENELRFLSSQDPRSAEAEIAAARALAKRRPHGTLDLHTSRFAATFGPGGEAVVPAFDVRPIRVTGAGDAWNAGDVLGHLAGFGPADRLLLANAVAALYIRGESGLAPTLPELVRFLEAEPALVDPR